MTALRVVSRDVVERFDDPRQSLTIRACYERFLLPEHDREASGGTRATYRTAIKYWEEFSGDPPVGAINSEVLQEWKTRTTEFIAARSRGSDGVQCFGKYARCLRAILRRIGPYEKGNPQAIEILDRVPYLKPPTPKSKKHRIIPNEHWDAIYRACSVATFASSKKAPGPLIWRTLHVLLLCCGPRSGDLFDLTWGQVTLDTRCPVWEWWIHSAHGWIDLTAAKTDKHQVIPLPAVLRKHLDALRACLGNIGPETPLFPVGGDVKERNTVRKLIQRAAGIDEPYTFHDMRDNCNMLWNRANFPAGDWVLGHAIKQDGSTQVNRQFYQVGIPYMIDALPKLDLPAGMNAGPG